MPKQKDIVVHVEGANLSDELTADLGQGVKVKSVALDDHGNLEVTVDLLASAKPGDRTLTLTRGDSSMTSSEKALTVTKEE